MQLPTFTVIAKPFPRKENEADDEQESSGYRIGLGWQNRPLTISATAQPAAADVHACSGLCLPKDPRKLAKHGDGTNGRLFDEPDPLAVLVSYATTAHGFLTRQVN